jgi:uncharacterized protein (TIGR02145 family)
MKNKLYKTMIALALGAMMACNDKNDEPKKDNSSTNTFTDPRDNQTYKIVKIGNQTWMAENLNYASAGALCYSNSSDSCAKYGKLYGISDLTSSLCPNGWHISTDQDWKTLEVNQGMSQADADKETPSGIGSRTITISKLLKGGSSGLEVLYSGVHNTNITFGDVGNITAFWTSTEKTAGNYYFRGISKNNTNSIDRDYRNDSGNPKYKFCIRCVQN